jgi:hypothetical protein
MNHQIEKVLTLNGSLSVLKATPGTYFSQTGNPLYTKTEHVIFFSNF